MRSVLFSLAIGLCCLSSLSAAEEARLDLSLRPLRWQTMPQGVQRVYSAPDGKTFVQRTPPRNLIPPGGISTSVLIDGMRDEIVAEFKQDMPQIGRARFALFEPKGRVWFWDSFSRGLSGYDGRQWTIHPFDSSSEMIVGRAHSRGMLIDADANRFVGGAAWFLSSSGVYRYDGATWTYTKMLEGAGPTYSNRLRLVVSADGKSAVVHQDYSRNLWIYSAGQWNKREYFSQEKPKLWHMAINNSREAWVQLGSGETLNFQFDVAGQITDKSSGKDKDSSVKFGEAWVKHLRALYQDDQGRTFVAADSIAMGDAGPVKGLLILDAAGKGRVVAGPDIPAAWRNTSPSVAAPIMTASGEQAWLPNRELRNSPTLMDLAQGKVVDAIPGVNLIAFQAVDSEGRLYLLQSSPLFPSASVGVYSPGAPELPVLTFVRQDIQSFGLFEVGDDGSIWSFDTDKNLIRWDGSAWIKLKKLGSPPPTQYLAGAGGVMLVVRSTNSNSHLLFQGDRLIGEGGLISLAEQHRDVLVKAFAPGRVSAHKDEHTCMASDAQGNLWLQHAGTLRVLVGNRWHETVDGLLAVGSRSAIIQLLVPIGSGQKLYLSDLGSSADGGLSVFGEVKDGKPRFEKAPHLAVRYSNLNYPHTLRDREGALWIRQNTLNPTVNVEMVIGQFATRLTERGASEPDKKLGPAELIDHMGTIWLNEPSASVSSSANQLTLWRDGAVVQTLVIPGYEQTRGKLLSTGPGSVVAVTTGGLQQLVADGPDYKSYKVGPVYSLRNLVGDIQEMLCTSRGELVVQTRHSAAGRETYSLWILTLPRGS